MPDRPRRFSFPREARIRTPRDFDRIFAQQCRAADSDIAILADLNTLGITRMGIAVGRKYGNAVQRNRVKRRIREAFRLMRHELPAGLDLVVMPRAGRCPEQKQLQESFRSIIPKLLRRLQTRPAG